MEPVSVEGVVTLHRSEREGAEDCICCEGPHVYGSGIDTDPFEYPWSAEPKTSVHDWLNMQVSHHRFDLEGKRVRVTLEVVE
jgi:hypothetical protein